MERIVLAYSGGLDTSVAIPWLKEKYDAEIIAVTMDLGQGKELEAVRDRALATGAVRAHVLDLREEFARDYILPALKADAIYEDRYPMATALGRPLIAQKLVEIAEIEQAYVEITFERGVPVAINGVTMPALDLIASLSTIAGAHGVGRIDMVENRLVGIKSREIYEAPAAMVLHAAHKELQKFVTSKDLERLCRFVSLQYADIIYNGLWFTPTREALDAFVEKVQERVTGVIRLKLFKGDSRIVGRKSPYALYDHALATYDAGDRFDHTAAVGFIKIWGLPVETAARKAPGATKPSTIAVGKA